MNKDQIYKYLMSMLEEYCPIIDEGVIFFIKDKYVYYMNTDPSVTTLQVNIRKNFEKSVCTEIASAVTNQLNSDIPSGCYLVENGTYVYRRTVPLAVLSTKKDLALFLQDLDTKSKLGYKRLTEAPAEKPKAESVTILMNPFVESTTTHKN